jgi:ABC-type transporter Mla maintaining outer membrane lipid asymmetry ATPase subunit MlaF
MHTSFLNPKIPSIQMTGLTVGAHDDPTAPVLVEVNWMVGTGEYWVLGGMEASGKTDLLATAAGLTKPIQGQYRLFDQEGPAFGDQFMAERLRIGLVFDGGQLFHRLTVLENIVLPLRYHGERAGGDLAGKIAAVLELTELSEKADFLAGTLGRAWQKRVGLARALVLQPEILLLDNALGGLDSRHCQWWLDVLDQLSEGHPFMSGRPTTLVVTAEDLRPWKNRTVHLAILQKGRLAVLGRHAQMAEISDPHVRELLAEQPYAAA